MKKTILTFALMLAFCSPAVFADSFDNLTNLTPVQKQQLTQVHTNYKKESNDIETRIMEYNSKLAQIKNDNDKTDSQKSVLISAYERNLSVLNAKKSELDRDIDSKYKSIMTDEQYRQFKAQEVNVQDSFNKFLQK